MDIASGTGGLAIEIEKNVNAPLIVSDISYSRMQKTHNAFSQTNNTKDVSFIAFNAESISIKTDMIKFVTTNYGMQNIGDSEKAVKELRRVCNGTFYSICTFIPHDDVINRNALKEYNYESMRVDTKYKEFMELQSWNTNKVNSIYVDSTPTVTGEIAKGFGIDGFPVAKTVAEYCVVVGE